MNLEQLGLLDRPPSPDEIQRQMRAYTVRYVALVAAVSLVIGALIGRQLARDAVAPELAPGWQAATLVTGGSGAQQLTSTPMPLRIYISGAVNQAKVIELPGGSLVADALAAAGGPAPDADLDAVNLAAPLANHQHVQIPARSASPTMSVTPDTSSTSALVNLNTASLAELLTLPGIGEVRAQAILAYRAEHGPFGRIEDLQKVSGIGPVTYENLAPYITVDR